jgi:type III secretion protein T
MFAIDNALFELIERSQPYILALIMAFARISAVLQIFPLFTATNVRGQIRAVFALILTIPVIPMIHDDLVSLKDPQILTLALMIGKEFLVGILLGALMAIPFWSVQTAGDIIDFERSASAANLSDPVNANENSLTGTILLYAALAIFVSIGGLKIFLSMIYDSYQVIKPMQALPNPGMELVTTFGMLLTKMFTIGIVVAGPVMIALAVIDLTLIFASRIAKQVPVYDFSIIMKNLCVAAFIPLYAIFLSHYVMDDWRTVMQFIRNFFRIGISG